MNRTELVPEWQLRHHARLDPHRKTSALAEIILGGQDGAVAVLGALLGVAAASASAHLVIAAGMATAFADAVSMAAVAYTSMLAQGDVYLSEREREYRHIREVPSLEQAEVREIYAQKGFRGALLDRIVATIVADPDVWVAVMMSEEHHLVPVDRMRTLRSAVVVGVSTMVGALLPVLPFFFLDVRVAVWVSIAIAASALFAVGAYKARVTLGKPWKAGAEMAVIGIVSALVGWAIGAVFGVNG
jgi:VIT1/CCC1 family predicted Fe2+/Mn2+ transporter